MCNKDFSRHEGGEETCKESQTGTEGSLCTKKQPIPRFSPYEIPYSSSTNDDDDDDDDDDVHHHLSYSKKQEAQHLHA